MSLLLDTHILIALIENRSRELPSAMQEAVSNPAMLVNVSVASLWEIAIKVRLGKLPLYPPVAALPSLIENLGYRLIDINQYHALADLAVAPPTRDPFDRLLLAQCQVEGLALVTLDRALAAHPLAWQAA